jgi:ankyrin repeat protein
MLAPNIQLTQAILNDDGERIRALLQEGVVRANDNSAFSLSPLLRAALYGKPNALKTLLEFGADKKTKDKQGRTALDLAHRHNHQEIVEILLHP